MTLSRVIRYGTDPVLPYAVLLVLNISLVWLLPYFPTQDGPSHLYNLVILKDLVHGGKEWGAYFTHDVRLLPNLGFHLVAYPLLYLLSPMAVERVFLSLYILLMGISVPFLLRSFGVRPLPLSYFVFPVLFNYALMLGFYSFSLAVPCMLMGIAAAWLVRTRSLAWRAAVFNGIGFLLYFLHLIPFAIYILFLGSMIAGTTHGLRKACRELCLLLLILSPCILMTLAYLFQSAQGGGQGAPYQLSLFSLARLAGSLALASLYTFSPWQLAPWAFFAFLAYLSFRTSVLRVSREGKMNDEDRSLVVLLCTMTMVYFLAPEHFAGGGLFNQRLPWVLFLLLLPLLRIPATGFLHHYQRVLFPGLAFVFFVFNGFVLHGESSRVVEFLGGMKADIPKGTFCATYITIRPSWSRIDPLLHAASYYGMEKGCVDAGNYEADVPHFPVRSREWRIASPSSGMIAFFPSRIDWAGYPAIHYLLGWGIATEDRKKLMENFELDMEKKRFTLWRRKAQGGFASAQPDSLKCVRP
jgi:hypothetical protein